MLFFTASLKYQGAKLYDLSEDTRKVDHLNQFKAKLVGLNRLPLVFCPLV